MTPAPPKASDPAGGGGGNGGDGGGSEGDKKEEVETDTLAKWLAAGFTLLTGLLAWFGVVEGTLDRALRTYPHQSLLIFCLVGGAVIGSLSVALIPASAKLSLSVPLIAVLLLAILCYSLPDVGAPEDWPDWQAQVAGGVLVFLILIGWKTNITATAATLILATAAFSFGMYGAAKIGVLSKSFDNQVDVTASVAREADAATSTITAVVKAGRLEERQVLQLVLIDTSSSEDRDDDDAILGQAILVADVGGQLEQTRAFRVASSVERAAFRVDRCEFPDPTDTTEPRTTADADPDEFFVDTTNCTTGSMYAQFGVMAGTPPPTTTTTTTSTTTTTTTTTTVPPRGVALSIVLGELNDTADVIVDASGLKPGQQLAVEVKQGDDIIALSGLRAGSDGSVDWTLPVPATPGCRITATVSEVSDDGSSSPVASAAYLVPVGCPLIPDGT